mmetsp:Transcript_45646/g.85261  ORF Transcript_45646/g.85261 Transcript_45646/m.85261 type:complete len:190 (-) Transcript_45646:129-698(-)
MYEGWLPDMSALLLCAEPCTPMVVPVVSEDEMFQLVIPRVLALVNEACSRKHRYLWGGTLGPDFDCSGLLQWAFSEAGVWIPRDAFQQHAFAIPVSIECARPGDLVFFGKQGLINHVGICVQAAGEDMPLRYMHCSSSTHGRDGIGSDDLHISSDTIGAHYARAFVSIGRVHAKVVTEEHIGVLTRTTE